MLRNDFKEFQILIVDDFANMRSTLKKMMQSLGAEQIDMASNGRDAIDRLRRTSYDIVLCDYNLGEGKNGQQVLEEGKAKKLIRYSTVFVMITAENTHDMVMGAVEYRPDDYLTKPFNKELLGTRLRRILERKENLERIEAAVEKGEYGRAIGLCDDLVAKRPRNANELKALKVDLCLTIGNYPEAQRVCEEVLAQRSVPWAMMGLGRIHFYKKEYMAAKDVFTDLIERHKAYMDAYDWLAKSWQALGKPREAQDVLLAATKMSPNSVLRQQSLAELAERNSDFQLAERSYRRSVGLGRYSVYRNPQTYTGLARALVQNAASQDALKVLGSMRKEFEGEPAASFQAALGEGMVLKQLGLEQEARAAYAEAGKLFDQVSSQLPAKVTMDFARACLGFGDKERGAQLLQEVVRNHHEEQAILDDAQRAFEDSGMGTEGSALIAAARSEVAKLNNEGVGLAKQGRLDDAIRLFEEAAARMSSNATVNLNAAQVLLAHMQKHGREDRYLYQVRQYLQRVSKVDPSNTTYQRLLNIYEKMLSA